MKMNNSRLLSALLVIFSIGTLVGCDDLTSESIQEIDYPIKLTKLYNGKSISSVEHTISRYIRNFDNSQYLAEALNDRIDQLEEDGRSRYDYQCINIEWEDTRKNEIFTVHMANNPNFDNEYTYTTDKTSVGKELGFYVPNTTYYYKVVGSKSGESKVDSFLVNAPVRYIYADTTINVRDIGGWTTANGDTINYGKMYRGGALDESPNASYMSDETRKIFDYLNIKGEIDLRGDDIAIEDNTSQELLYKNKINPDYPILREGLVWFGYENMTSNEEKAKNNLPKIFSFLANEGNYPVYFHCSVGADRTGTLAYIIETLLGVKFEHAMIDYELTSFTTDTAGGIRCRSPIVKNGDMYDFVTPSESDLGTNYFKLAYASKLLMDKYASYSTNSQEVMEKYLLDMGVQKSHIDKVKEIMLG